MSGQYEKALDELELRVQTSANSASSAHRALRYLPSQPYQDSPVLHLYAGLICLYLAQPSRANTAYIGVRTLRDAEHYFERVKYLDPDNIIATTWLEKVRFCVGIRYYVFNLNNVSPRCQHLQQPHNKVA